MASKRFYWIYKKKVVLEEVFHEDVFILYFEFKSWECRTIKRYKKFIFQELNRCSNWLTKNLWETPLHQHVHEVNLWVFALEGRSLWFFLESPDFLEFLDFVRILRVLELQLLSFLGEEVFVTTCPEKYHTIA
jgi:hypothetical protein